MAAQRHRRRARRRYPRAVKWRCTVDSFTQFVEQVTSVGRRAATDEIMSAKDEYLAAQERLLACSRTYFSSEVTDTHGVPVDRKENL